MIPNLPLRFYPLFELCDAAMVSLRLKQEHGHRVHIFGLWSAAIFNCHAGNLLSHILLGKPTINAFSNFEYIALVSLVFFTISLCPRNMMDTLLQIPPIHVFSIVICEIFRSYKILKGINEGQKAYPGTLWPSIIIGSLRGNGSGWMKPVRSIILSDPSSFFKGEWFSPSRVSRIAIVSSVLLTICKQDEFIFVSLVGLLISEAFTNAYPI